MNIYKDHSSPLQYLLDKRPFHEIHNNSAGFSQLSLNLSFHFSLVGLKINSDLFPLAYAWIWKYLNWKMVFYQGVHYV